MKLVFLSHVSDCAGGAQRCLLDLLRGLKRIHPDWHSIWFFLVREICLMPAPLILMAIGSYKWNGGL